MFDLDTYTDPYIYVEGDYDRLSEAEQEALNRM